MFLKVVCVLTVCAVVTVLAEEGHSSQYIHKHDDHHTKVEFKDKHGHHDHDYYTPPKYEFEYKIKNPHTGDHKSQHEQRHDDSVKGHWSLQDPDGTDRHVHYHADKHSGFHADVKHSTHHIVPHHHH
ncbi:hypothetical protein PYW07_015488 [Mythimna separata]|uniref:Uncharacterized protein n=1 Tax=Mythimna separata TaxID=271217 RepID=A0AAD8DZL2_MYTSE|nr:hypothetical protein PYW07_015488 [Mythimna separata]